MTRGTAGCRSHCPISYALDLFGDQWTLLVVRDVMLFGKRTFQEFLGSSEGIATNVLTDRLARLEAAGILMRRPDSADGRRSRYLLTDRGIDLLPLMIEMVGWSARHDPASLATPAAVAKLRSTRAKLAAGLRAEGRGAAPPKPMEPRRSRRARA